MSKMKLFGDGCSVEWIDRETLKYSKGEFSLFVWVDFEPGFFSSGMIIKSTSIVTWDSFPEGSSNLIDENEKVEIIGKIQEYYKSNRNKCRVE